jgi:hypothetical protein
MLQKVECDEQEGDNNGTIICTSRDDADVDNIVE